MGYRMHLQPMIKPFCSDWSVSARDRFHKLNERFESVTNRQWSTDLLFSDHVIFHLLVFYFWASSFQIFYLLFFLLSGFFIPHEIIIIILHFECLLVRVFFRGNVKKLNTLKTCFIDSSKKEKFTFVLLNSNNYLDTKSWYSIMFKIF